MTPTFYDLTCVQAREINVGDVIFHKDKQYYEIKRIDRVKQEGFLFRNYTGESKNGYNYWAMGDSEPIYRIKFPAQVDHWKERNAI